MSIPANSRSAYVAVYVNDNGDIRFGRLTDNVQSALEKAHERRGFVLQTLTPDFQPDVD